MYRGYILCIKNKTQQRMSENNLRSSSNFENHDIRNCWSEMGLTYKDKANNDLEISTDCTKPCPVNLTDFQQCLLPDCHTKSISQNDPSVRTKAEVERLYCSSSRASFHSAATEEQPPVHLTAIKLDSESSSEECEPAICLHDDRSQFDGTEVNALITFELQDDEFSDQRILSESKFLHSEAFTVAFGTEAKEGLSLQKAFSKFKQQRQNEIKKDRKCKKIPSEVRLRNMSNPDRMWKLRMKFLNQAKKYFGTPYSRKYWTCEDSEYYSPLFLDCCGLVRKVLQDLREQFQFRIGPWNQAYMFDTLPITVASHEQMKPGDLVFISAIYHNLKAKKQKHNMVHVEIWLGEGVKTIGARWQKGKVQVFDSYQFNATSYHSPIYMLKSIDTWLTGDCQSHCPEHPWKRKAQFKPSKKSVFATSSTDKLSQSQVLETNEQREYQQNNEEDQELDEQPGLQQEQTEYKQGGNLQHEKDQEINHKTPKKEDKQVLQMQLTETKVEQLTGKILKEKELGGQLLEINQLNGHLLNEDNLTEQQLEEKQLIGHLMGKMDNVQLDSQETVHGAIEIDVAPERKFEISLFTKELSESQKHSSSVNKGAHQENMCKDDKEINNIQVA